MNSQNSGGVAVMELKCAHLHEPFIDVLRDMYDAENQLVKALPKLEQAASSPALKECLQGHFRVTEEHVRRVEKAFELLGEPRTSTPCPATKGLIEEAQDAAMMEEPLARDAAIICAAQRMEHYEIASYGTLRCWASHMGHSEIAQLFQATLQEERTADQDLTAIAEKECGNEGAGHAPDEFDLEV